MRIEFKNLWTGGLSDSKYVGAENSVAAIKNLSIHDELGAVRLNKAFVRKNAALFRTAPFTSIVYDNGGETWFFDEDGQVVRRATGGAYSDMAVINGTGGDGVSDAMEYIDDIYYARERRIGKFTVQSAGGGWAGRTEDWATPTGTGVWDRCMKIVNDILFISAGNVIDQVEGSTFTAAVLTFPADWKITSFGKYGTDLLIGMEKVGNSNISRIVRWNTWSTNNSFTSDDIIPESGVHSFLDMDNLSVAAIGTQGNLYYYDGFMWRRFKRIPSTAGWEPDESATVKLNASTNSQGRMLFGLSGQSSSQPSPLGIYSLYSYSEGTPLVLSSPLTISTGTREKIEINAMEVLGDGTLVCTWADTSGGSNVYGIDEQGANMYAEGYFDTRVVTSGDRKNQKRYKATVNYREIPAGTSFEIWASVDGGVFAAMTVVVDTTRRTVYSKNFTALCTDVQFRVKWLGATTKTPIFESLIVEDEQNK